MLEKSRANIRKEEKNLLNNRNAVPEGRFGTVPETVHDVLIPDLSFQLCSSSLSTQECVVRHGIGADTEPDSFMKALLFTLGFASKKEFIKDLKRRLDPMTFISLENGNILNAFVPTQAVLPEKVSAMELGNFAKWMRAFPSYTRLFALEDITKLAESKTISGKAATIPIATRYRLSRELAVFQAYHAFLDHIASNERKNPYIFYELAKLYGVTLFLWERKDANVAQIRCPYFETLEDLLDYSHSPTLPKLVQSS